MSTINFSMKFLYSQSVESQTMSGLKGPRSFLFHFANFYMLIDLGNEWSRHWTMSLLTRRLKILAVILLSRLLALEQPAANYQQRWPTFSWMRSSVVH